jgi:hypothetical protein
LKVKILQSHRDVLFTVGVEVVVIELYREVVIEVVALLLLM